MGANVTLAGHAARVGIQVHDYERIAAEDESDANWLRATLSVNVNSFSGVVETSLTTSELARLHSDLDVLISRLQGNLTFRAEEDALELAIQVHTAGTVLVKGLIRSRIDSQVVLSFQFESDQSFLQTTLSELSDAIRSFPRRKSG